MRTRIEPADVEAQLPAARALISRERLPELLASVDAGAFGTTPLNLEALDAVSRALACALACARHPALGRLAPSLAALIFAEEAAERLRPLAPDAEGGSAGFAASRYDDLAAGAAQDAVPRVLADAAGFVRFYREHPDAAKRLTRDRETARCLRSYFILLADTARKLPGAPVTLELDTPALRWNGLRSAPLLDGEPADLLPVSFDDLVGNEEYVKAGRRLARDVAGFDLASGRNPKNVRNQVLFVLGSPGCGKTVTAHAIGRYFLSLCEKAGVPGRMRVIRRTDWASSYQNQSANRLLEIFRDEVFEAPGVCGVYWPDIDTAFAARSDSDIRQEERSILGTLFGILDGTVGPRNGRWFLICDANTLRMDEATLSRLSQQPLRALGPQTPEDFVKLLRDVKLRGKQPWLPLSEREWADVGARCVREKLSGRSIDALAGRVLTEIEDFDEPDEYFSLPFERKQALVAKLSRPVGAPRLNQLLDEHVRFERDAQARAEAQRFAERVSEIRFHLAAERAAVAAPEGRADGA